MSEMVQRIAEAVWEARNPGKLWKDSEESKGCSIAYIEARAALVAMREPTTEMVEAGRENCDCGPGFETLNRDDMRCKWSAMIAEALR